MIKEFTNRQDSTMRSLSYLNIGTSVPYVLAVFF